MGAPPSTKGGNVGSEKYLVEKHHFDLLDQLPKSLRQQLVNAPYPFAAGEIVEYLANLRAAGWSREEAAQLVSDRFTEMLKRKIAEEATRLYGPEHPQAKEAGK